MTMTTGNSAAILTPEEVNTYLIDPVEQESLAMQVANVVRTESHSYRIPVPGDQPSADWVAEGEEITPSNATFGELVITPGKLAGLVPVTRELANDSSPEATTQVGQLLAADIATKVDLAFFGGSANANAQKGLASLATTAGKVQVVAAGASFTNLDPFEEAVALSEVAGASVTSFVANPLDALALAKLKVGAGSNQALLGSDPSQPTRRLIGGVPLLRSPHVPKGTVWALPQKWITVVIREDATIEFDKSAYFTSDRIAVKAIMRVGFGITKLPALVKITVGA
jgi:HK97 family phage major capsid protein